MLTLVLGRAGAGKSEYLYRLAAQRAREGAKNAIFLVPETYSHQAERQLCLYGGDAINLSCEVLTFRRLANRVFSAYGGLAEPTLDEPGRILVMQQALENAQSGLHYYRENVRTELLDAMIALADEFKSVCITPEALARIAQDTPEGLAAKLGDLSLIYTEYCRLCEETRLDSRDLLSLCAEKLKGTDFFDGRDVYIDGFSGFTPQEFDILARLRRARVTAAFTVDSLKEPDSLFDKPARAALLLESLISDGHADKLYFKPPFEYPLEPPPRRAAGLAILEKSLFRFTDEAGTCEDNEVRFHIASDIFGECEYAAAQVRELLRSGARAKDIAVAAGDFESYRLPLTAAFTRCGIPYYVSENAALESKSVAAIVLRALDIACQGFSHKAVFAYLKTGLSGFTDDEVNELENYCLLWRVRPAQWTGRAPWRMHPGGFGMAFDEESEEKLRTLNALRDRLREPLLTLSKALEKSDTAREKLLALYDFTQTIGLADAIERRADELRASAPDEADEYLQIWDLFVGLIDQFDELAGESRMDAQSFAKTFRRMLAACRIGVIPPSVDRVSLGSLSSAAAHGAQHLLLLGAYDQAFPPEAGGGSLLSDHDREALEKKGVELGYTPAARESEALLSLYTAIATVRQTLFLSVPERDSTGGALTPAFLYRRAKKLLPDAPTSRGEVEAWLSAPRTAFDYAWSHSSPAALAAREALRAWPGFAALYPGREGEADFFDDPQVWRLGEGENRRIFGENPRLSASRLEDYNKCPFLYFSRYGLSLSSHRAAGFDAPQAGIFIHYVLEGTVRDIREKGGFAACTLDDAKAFAEKHVREYISRDIPDFAEKSARFRYLFLRLRRNLDFLVENLYEEFSRSAFSPLDFELRFSGEMPPVEIGLDSGAHASLSGIADRVDGWVRDGVLYLRVIDYKSGAKAFSYGEIAAGLGMQLPVYLFALQANARLYLNRHPELDADAIVPAGILYTPARLETISAPHDLGEDELSDKLSDKLKRSGIVLEDAQVLDAMEPDLTKTGEGRFIPVRIYKSGVRGAVSEEQFALLGRHVRGMLKATAELMAAGHYFPSPTHFGQSTACRTCDYRAICGLDAGAHPERVREIKNKSAAEFFADAGKEAL